MRTASIVEHELDSNRIVLDTEEKGNIFKNRLTEILYKYQRNPEIFYKIYQSKRFYNTEEVMG